MIPQRRDGQSFEDHQADMAEWLGTDVATMNRDHDRLHASLCHWLGIPSHSLRHAAGEKLTNPEYGLAMLEEQAVLHTQRLIVMAGTQVPQSGDE